MDIFLLVLWFTAYAAFLSFSIAHALVGNFGRGILFAAAAMLGGCLAVTKLESML